MPKARAAVEQGIKVPFPNFGKEEGEM